MVGDNPGSDSIKNSSKEGIPGDFRQHELAWRALYDFLKAEGYELRPRYKPNKKLSRKEDLLPLQQPNVMDAVRIFDKTKVCLKIMKPSEIDCTRIASLKHRSAPGNHSVPILDFIQLPDKEETIGVMPYLRQFDEPQFGNLSEVIDAISQFLEGIEFLHKHGIAHRDACWRNLMMDASELVPDGWHFARPWTEDGFKPVKSVPRSTVTMKYYFIDFGLSLLFGKPEPAATGIVGQDRTVPEFQYKDQNARYNPLKLDIYQLGNAFQTRLLERYDGLEFLEPLLKAMTSEGPNDRPTASEARELFAIIIKNLDLQKAITLKPGARTWRTSLSGGTSGGLLKFVATAKTWVLGKTAQLAEIRKRFF